jgi:hypothetical protein
MAVGGLNRPLARSTPQPTAGTYRLVVEEIENLEPLDPSTTGDAVDGLHW